MRAFIAPLVAGAILLAPTSSARAEPLDPRSDAINRIVPGQSVRVLSPDRSVEGTFVTNRSDSLLLRHQAERISLAYSEIQRVEVRRPATSRGMVIGMIVGGLGFGAVAAAEGSSTPLFIAASGVFFGGFLGGSIGSAFPRWDRVYEATPAHPDSTPASPHR